MSREFLICILAILSLAFIVRANNHKINRRNTAEKAKSETPITKTYEELQMPAVSSTPNAWNVNDEWEIIAPQNTGNLPQWSGQWFNRRQFGNDPFFNSHSNFPSHQTPTYNFNNNRDKPFSAIDTKKPESVTTNTVDDKGNRVVTSYSSVPTHWTTQTIVYPSHNWITSGINFPNFDSFPNLNGVPKLTPPSTPATPATSNDATTTIKTPISPPPFPTLEDFLKSQYAPKEPTTTQETNKTPTNFNFFNTLSTPIQPKPTYNFDNNQENPFSAIDTQKPGWVTTNSVDDKGNRVVTSYSSTPMQWSTSRTWGPNGISFTNFDSFPNLNEVPKFTPQNSATPTTSNDATTTIKTPTSPSPFPSFEDFLKSHYEPKVVTTTQETNTIPTTNINLLNNLSTSQQKPAYNFNNNRGNPFSAIDTQKPGSVTTSTVDDKGNRIVTSYTSTPIQWSTQTIVHPSYTWSTSGTSFPSFDSYPNLNEVPKVTPQITPATPTTSSDAIFTTTIKTPASPQPLPSLEDFLKSQYGPKEPTTTQETFITSTTSSTPSKPVTTIRVEDLPVTHILSNGKITTLPQGIK